MKKAIHWVLTLTFIAISGQLAANEKCHINQEKKVSKNHCHANQEAKTEKQDDGPESCQMYCCQIFPDSNTRIPSPGMAEYLGTLTTLDFPMGRLVHIPFELFRPPPAEFS